LNSTQNNDHPRTVEEKRALLKKLLEERTVPARQNPPRVLEQPPEPSTSPNDWEEIPQDNYVFERSPEYLSLVSQREAASAIGIEYPFFKVVEPSSGAIAMVNGRQCINFSGYNYLGMSGDPVVSRAAMDAIKRFGTSASASRLVAGQRPIHLELESALADHVGTEDALSFVTGYLAGVTTIGHLFKPGDLIVHDALIHNCTLIGSKLSGARTVPFPHNDAHALENILRELRVKHRRVLVLIEGIYSMDGDIADLPRIIKLKRRFKTHLMVDEAHSIGVLGRTGRGIGEHFDVDPRDVDLWMGTLSKAMGSCGGYIAGSRALIDYLRHTAPGFVYSVGMPPPVAAAALAALRLLRAQPERIDRLRDLSRLFLERARTRGLNTGSSRDTPVIPIIVGDSRRCGYLAQALYQRGINIQPIVFPAVEDRASRLRVFLTCLHTEMQITSTVDAIAEELERLADQRMSFKRTYPESE
jgi:8-amino-7-oxononanoate synthase